MVCQRKHLQGRWENGLWSRENRVVFVQGVKCLGDGAHGRWDLTKADPVKFFSIFMGGFRGHV